MYQAHVMYQWNRTIATHFTQLSRPQQKMLSLFSYGVSLARRCTLARVAEALFWQGKADTVERRLQRFLANRLVNWKQGCRGLARWVLGSLVFGGGQVVLLVDETALQEHLRVMVVSLAYRGRAIPLAWWCYHQNGWPMSQVKLIDTLLGWVAGAIPAGCRVLVQADRGIGSSPALLRAITKRHWYYLVRVQASVRLLLGPDGAQMVRFGDMLCVPGQQWSGAVQAFKKAKWLNSWAIAYWGYPHKQPWLLLTNWPELQGQAYGWRMWEELAFRDLKSYGWHWQRSKVWDPQHANRLWLVLAVAYAWMISLGTQAIHTLGVRNQVQSGRSWRRSVFALGLRVLCRAPILFKQLAHAHELLFIPNSLPLGESVVQ